jgi:hypothetical protein
MGCCYTWRHGYHVPDRQDGTMRAFALLGLGTTVLAVASVLTPNGNVAPESAPMQSPTTAVATIAPAPAMTTVDTSATADMAPVADAAPDAAPQVDTAPQSYVFECIQGTTTTFTDSPCPPGAESRQIALREPNSYVSSSPDTGYVPAQYSSDDYGADVGYPGAGGVYGVYGRRHYIAPRRQSAANNRPVYANPPHRSAPAHRGR